MSSIQTQLINFQNQPELRHLYSDNVFDLDEARANHRRRELGTIAILAGHLHDRINDRKYEDRDLGLYTYMSPATKVACSTGGPSRSFTFVEVQFKRDELGVGLNVSEIRGRVPYRYNVSITPEHEAFLSVSKYFKPLGEPQRLSSDELANVLSLPIEPEDNIVAFAALADRFTRRAEMIEAGSIDSVVKL